MIQFETMKPLHFLTLFAQATAALQPCYVMKQTAPMQSLHLSAICATSLASIYNSPDVLRPGSLQSQMQY